MEAIAKGYGAQYRPAGSRPFENGPLEATEHPQGPEHVEAGPETTRPQLGNEATPAYNPPISGVAHYHNPLAQHTPTATEAAEHLIEFARDRKQAEA
jgi:hypothetical protein